MQVVLDERAKQWLKVVPTLPVESGGAPNSSDISSVGRLLSLVQMAESECVCVNILTLRFADQHGM